ncbi:hypothetical protein BH10ACT8_BH10ACT8_20740 [soil metagenome]
MNRFLAIELRRGPGAAAAVLTLVLFYVALHRYGPILTWMDATSAIGASTQLCGPAAAGVASYCGARAVRRCTFSHHRLAARPELAVTGSELGAFLTWVVGTWVTAAVVTLLAVWHHCHWGHPSVAWNIASGAGLVAEVAIGYVVGRLLPYLMTPAVSAVIIFLGTGLVLNDANTWWYFLSPLNSQDWLPFDGLHTVHFALQALFLLAVANLAVAGAALRLARSDRASLATFGSGLVVAVVAVVALASGDGRFWDIDSHIVWTCSGHSPSVCIHPAFAAIQTPLDQQLRSIAGRTTGTPFQVNRFEQRPRGLGSDPTPGAVAFAIDEPIAADIPDTAVDAAVSLLGADSCQTRLKPSSSRVEQVVVEWVAGQSVLGPDHSVEDPAADEIVNQFTGLTDAQKRQWISRHATAIRNCRFVAQERP